ncbi:peptide-methionine (S)-S-oxide reductase MsrA [Candidatus Pacearchaeota archaeon]|nr:peptide-methionine (S)-S-oxide reductase MsrA [Candidatus Pacearchaeota archaeon]
MKEKIYFGMGCFWKSEYVFSKAKGVLEAEVGYMGGDDKKEKVKYEDIHSSDSGYAEVVKVEFDTSVVSYEKLLEIFWKNHNPTQLNRQGPDVGEAYRSVIFYTNEKQKKAALKLKEEFQNDFDRPIVTQIAKAKKFHKAENYHQEYYKKNGMACY